MTNHNPVVIGITGNIATGKSTVANMLGDSGADVIDADKVAHSIMQSGTDVHAQIVDTFGVGVLREDGEIDRAKLGVIVFASPRTLACLEAIVHPATLDSIQHQIDNSSARFIVVEAIKLIESGMVDSYDSIWVTTCPSEEQIRRLVNGRGMSHAAAVQRVQSQPPQAKKVSRADVVIDTSGSMSQTCEQVKKAWAELVHKNSCTGIDRTPCAKA